jgi:hypothetical protein
MLLTGTASVKKVAKNILYSEGKKGGNKKSK